MKKSFLLLFALCCLISCTKELKFEQKKFEKKFRNNDATGTEISIDIPIAVDGTVVSDSINKALFLTMKEIVYVGEKPFEATDYRGLENDFMASYQQVKKENKDELGWSAEINGSVIYTSDAILNIELNHYAFTGGAHGYSGKRSLIIDIETGKLVANKSLFSDEKAFKKMAELKFRNKYAIPINASINATDFMFENEAFQLPQTYLFTKNGFLLYYNVYEIASYAQGNFEVLIPYNEMKPYLKTI